MSNIKSSGVIEYYENKIKEFTSVIIDKKLNDLFDNIDRYLNVITTTLKYNWFCKYYPTLVKKTVFNIYRADTDYDYFYEKQFEDYAYTVKWVFTEQGCKDCSCLATYPLSKNCSNIDGPKRLQNGLITCQPQCFINDQYIGYNPLYGTWSESICIRRDPELMKFFIDASLRSDPTGRDKYSMRITFPNNTREIEVHVDDAYCDQFGLVYDATRGSCETTNNNFSYAITFITGESLMKMYRLGENQMSLIADRMIQWASHSQNLQKEYFTELKTREQAMIEWMSSENNSIDVYKLQIPFQFSTHDSSLTTGPIIINLSTNPDTKLKSENYSKNVSSQKIVNKMSTSLRYKVDAIGQFIENAAPEIGAAFLIDKTTNKIRQKIVKFEPVLKRLVPLVTNNAIESNVSKLVTTAAMRQMVKTTTITAISVSLATKIIVGTLKAGNILMAVGGIIDLAFNFLWDPINLTPKPLNDENIKKIIQETTVQNVFPIELTPEIAWDEYYRKNMDIEEYSLIYLKAAFTYVKHRTFDHDLGIIPDTQPKHIIKNNHLPMANFEVEKIKSVLSRTCILSTCLYVIAPYNIVIYLLTLFIVFISTIQTKIAVNNYFSLNKYNINNNNIAYII